MIKFSDIEGICFVGIGGIGMSALALYFRKGGFDISGYDRSSSAITGSLTDEGCSIVFDDDPGQLPALYTDINKKEKVIVVYTPAIPAESRILGFFSDNGYRLYKRSEILGSISEHTDTLAVAGTHGKTTVSTMTAHLLKQSHVDCSAFLGGISKNYGSNLILGESRFTVMEADEFDRSFHRLSPAMAVVTSVDPDHLEIYGDHASMIEGYNVFISKIRLGGTLVVNSRIRDVLRIPSGLKCFTYGFDDGSDFRAFNIEHRDDHYRFSVATPEGPIADLRLRFPGIINVLNFTAAIAIATMCGVTEEEIRKGVLLFSGVKRRFDVRIDTPGLTYVDDYAHHPEEIRAFITCCREYYKGRRLTGIFQPHLFSRTKDHAEGFAAMLDQLDEVILLPIYPAREKPVEGVTSALIFDRMKNPSKRMLSKGDIPAKLDASAIDVLLTIGAGDIDTLVKPIEEMLRRERNI